MGVLFAQATAADEGRPLSPNLLGGGGDKGGLSDFFRPAGSSLDSGPLFRVLTISFCCRVPLRVLQRRFSKLAFQKSAVLPSFMGGEPKRGPFFGELPTWVRTSVAPKDVGCASYAEVWQFLGPTNGWRMKPRMRNVVAAGSVSLKLPKSE